MDEVNVRTPLESALLYGDIDMLDDLYGEDPSQFWNMHWIWVTEAHERSLKWLDRRYLIELFKSSQFMKDGMPPTLYQAGTAFKEWFRRL